jgi:hypothetical protein
LFENCELLTTTPPFGINAEPHMISKLICILSLKITCKRTSNLYHENILLFIYREFSIFRYIDTSYHSGWRNTVLWKPAMLPSSW